MSEKVRLLCIAPYPIENAAVRYRLLQYVPYLGQRGIEVTFLPFMDSRFFQQFYEPGRALQQTLGLIRAALRRCLDVIRASRFDVVMIHREAAPAGPPFFETLLTRAIKKPVVYDFDDAIYVLHAITVHRRIARILKCPQKVPRILRMSHAVIAGNQHLGEYASSLNNDVTIIPTVIDAEQIRPNSNTPDRQRKWSQGRDDRVVLGWVGSHSSYPYLEMLFPVLQDVARRRKFLLRVVGAGRDIHLPGVEVDNCQWSLSSELELLQSIDIGLYPMFDDSWALGKSAFKAIQYMAVAIPAVCSPVGAVLDVVQDGAQGYLPRDKDQWVEYICTLIDDPDLRRDMGLSGRARVESWYCLQQQAPRLSAIIERMVG